MCFRNPLGTGSGLSPFPSPEHALNRRSCLYLQFILPVFQLPFDRNLPTTLPFSSYNIVLSSSYKITFLSFIIPYLKIKSQQYGCYYSLTINDVHGSNKNQNKFLDYTYLFIACYIMHDYDILLWVNVNHPGRANKAAQLFATCKFFQDAFLTHKVHICRAHVQ